MSDVDIHGEPRTYPCADCGKMRSKAEGGTTFTVCDECWDKHRAAYAADDAPADQTIAALRAQLATAEAALKAVTEERDALMKVFDSCLAANQSLKTALDQARVDEESAQHRANDLEYAQIPRLLTERDEARASLAAMTSRAEKAERERAAEREARHEALNQLGQYQRLDHALSSGIGRSVLVELDAAIAAKDKAEADVKDYCRLFLSVGELGQDETPQECLSRWKVAAEEAQIDAAAMREALNLALSMQHETWVGETFRKALSSDAGASILARLKAAEEERDKLRLVVKEAWSAWQTSDTDAEAVAGMVNTLRAEVTK